MNIKNNPLPKIAPTGHSRNDTITMTGNEQNITLGVLNAVHENHHVTQRGIAREVGIALGLANAYLKRCAKKGLIKIKQIPANRYSYYLTPQGFAEKSRLTGDFLSQGFQFFRIARAECGQIFEHCCNSGARRVVLHGLTDLAEIAVLCASDYDVELIAIIDPTSELSNYSGIPIVKTVQSATPFDALVITDLGNPQLAFDRLLANEEIPISQFFAPTILKISGLVTHGFNGGPS